MPPRSDRTEYVHLTLPAEPAQLAPLRHAMRDYLSPLPLARDRRDEIVLANPNLLRHTLTVQRTWEAELARSLARRRGLPAPDPATQLDAALGLVLLRVAFRQWRAPWSTQGPGTRRPRSR